MDDAACAAGLYVVLWVEDLERFAGTGHADKASLEKETERLNPIRSLLYFLHRLERVCVVLASQSLHERFDLEKIARYVEKPPVPAHDDVWKILHAFRKGYLIDAKNAGIIDPMRERLNEGWTLANAKMGAFALYERVQPKGPGDRGESPMDIRYALAELCRQPRTLKMAMRACLDAWGPLKGEIDFDDVLLLSILRVAEPAIFAFVERNFRKSLTDPQSFLDSALKEMPADTSRERAEAVHKILFVVFPPDGRDVLFELIGVCSTIPRSRPQRFARPSGEVYWRRYLSLMPPNDGDQAIIRRFQKPEERLGMVRDMGPRVEPFGCLLDDEALLRLFEEVIERAMKESFDDEPRGLQSVANMMTRFRAQPRGDVESVIEREVANAVTRNLALAHSIIRLVVKIDAGEGPFVIDKGLLRVREDAKPRPSPSWTGALESLSPTRTAAPGR